MPTRAGFYSSGGAAAAHGAFSGLEDFFDQLSNQHLQDFARDKQLQRQEALDFYKQHRTKVESGDETPEEAARATGLKPTMFGGLVPAQETMLARLNKELHPNTTTEEANVQMHALGPFRNSPDIPDTTGQLAESSPFAQPGSVSTTDETPLTEKIANLLNAKRVEAAQEELQKPEAIKKIGEFAQSTPGFGAGAIESETGNLPDSSIGADTTPMNIMGGMNPITHQFSTFNVQGGPSATQVGQRTGQEAAAAQPGQTTAKINSILQENPAELKKAATAQQQGIDIKTSPGNIAKEGRYQYGVSYNSAKAQDDAQRAGVDPMVANTYVRSTAIPGHVYAHFPPGTPPIVTKVATNQLANAFGGKIAFVTQQENSALAAIETARANYENIIGLLKNKAAATYKGNYLAAPANEIAAWLKSDPDLVAAQKDFAQVVQSLRAQAGQFGRLTQTEIFRALDNYPQINDPWDVILAKRSQFYHSLENAENPLFGK